MTAQGYLKLDEMPRVRLAHLPTPVEPLPNLSRLLGGPELWIKRDDQTGLATGGNKARKLEFLMAAAIEAGADTVITAGSTQSNHARQTAAAAARLGLGCHLVLYAPGGHAPDHATGNVLLDRLLGANIHWTQEHAPYKDTLGKVTSDVQAEGRKVHLIPYGGSNPVGMMGFVVAMRELAEQELYTGRIDAIAYGSSSGGTQAGMVLGAHLAGLLERVRLVGISVDEHKVVLANRVAELVSGGASLLGLDWRINENVPDVVDSYLGGGYAVVGEPEREAIRLLARHEGILADPVYTGRALAGLIDLIRQGEFKAGQRVMFWHTGGSAALFAFGDALEL